MCFWKFNAAIEGHSQYSTSVCKKYRKGWLYKLWQAQCAETYVQQWEEICLLHACLNNVNGALSENTCSDSLPELSRGFDLLPVARYQRVDLEFLEDHQSNLNSALLQN
jgi:hypothetical protein